MVETSVTWWPSLVDHHHHIPPLDSTWLPAKPVYHLPTLASAGLHLKCTQGDFSLPWTLQSQLFLALIEFTLLLKPCWTFKLANNYLHVFGHMRQETVVICKQIDWISPSMTFQGLTNGLGHFVLMSLGMFKPVFQRDQSPHLLTCWGFPLMWLIVRSIRETSCFFCLLKHHLLLPGHLWLQKVPLPGYCEPHLTPPGGVLTIDWWNIYSFFASPPIFFSSISAHTI